MRTVKLVYHINPFFATPFSDYPRIFPKFNRILIFIITKPPIVDGLRVDDRGRRHIAVLFFLPDYLWNFFENRLDLEIGGYHVGAFGRGNAVGPLYKPITVYGGQSNSYDCRARHDLR